VNGYNTMKIRINKKKISQILFCLGVIIKQFYILPSGMIQIGDIFLVTSFVFVIKEISISKFGNNKNDSYLMLYIILIFLINSIYSIIFLSLSFITSALYYLFNFLIVLSFRENSKDIYFLTRLQKALKLSLIMQALIYISGNGRVYSGVRYMGTFNDPNQFGFYVFSAALIIYAISVIQNQKTPYIWIVLMLWLVLQSASTGVAVGAITFVVSYIFIKLVDKNRKYMVLPIVVIIMLITLLIIKHSATVKLPSFISNSFMLARIEEKISKVFNGGSVLNNVSSDRGWFLLKNYWYMITYGAGEANNGRFVEWYGEIHSSIFGPLFYYGIIPFCIWVKWCVVQFKNMDKMLVCVYFSLLCESVTLTNVRQPFFWILLAIAGMKSIEKERNTY